MCCGCCIKLIYMGVCVCVMIDDDNKDMDRKEEKNKKLLNSSSIGLTICNTICLFIL